MIKIKNWLRKMHDGDATVIKLVAHDGKIYNLTGTGQVFYNWFLGKIMVRDAADVIAHELIKVRDGFYILHQHKLFQEMELLWPMTVMMIMMFC